MIETQKKKNMEDTIREIVQKSGMVGDDIIGQLRRDLRIMRFNKYPLYLIGDSGTGKTFYGEVLGQIFAELMGRQYHYLQLSQDQTKTGIIGGPRPVTTGPGMIEIQEVAALIGQAALDGDTVMVDEVTHSTIDIILNFNSFGERNARSSVGKLIMNADKRFRLIFASNGATHAGNVKLPVSFVQRVLPKPFSFPSWESEWQIARSIMISEYNEAMELGDVRFAYKVPDAILKWATGYIREKRHPLFPLSARTVCKLATLCAVEQWTLEHDEHKPFDLATQPLDPYFTDTTNRDSIAESIFKKISGGVGATGVDDYIDNEDLRDFRAFLSYIGVKTFNEFVLRAVGYHLPIEGLDHKEKSIKGTLAEGLFV